MGRAGRRIAALAVVAAAIAGVFLVRAVRPGRTGPPPPLVAVTSPVRSIRALSGGAVEKRWANGAVFTGRRDATVRFFADPDGVVTAASVSVPGPASPAATAALAARYAAAGRSEQLEGAAVGIQVSGGMTGAKPTPYTVYDSGCLGLNGADARWGGCYLRRRIPDADPDAWYLADSSQAGGHARAGGHWLVSGSVAQDYTGRAVTVKYSPGGDIDASRCTATRWRDSDIGRALGRTYTLCPRKIHLEKTLKLTSAEWQGCEGRDTQPGVSVGALTAVPNGGSATLVLRVGYRTVSRHC